MQTQTRRHSFIVSLLGVRHVIVAVNKMDLVDFSQQVFDDIRQEYLAFAEGLNIPDIRFVPISRAARRQCGQRQRARAVVQTARR